MILIVSNECDSATDLFVESLKKRRLLFQRLNTDTLMINASFSIGVGVGSVNRLTQYGRNIDFNKINSVWYRRPVLPKLKINSAVERKFAERESLAAMDALWASLDDKFWVSSPYSIKEASSKFRQLLVAEELGFNIPETIITNNVNEVNDFFEHFQRLMLYKPVTTGHLSSSSARTQLMTYSKKIESTDLSKMVLVKNCPGMFQRYIEKEYEIRSTVIGKKVFSAKIDSQKYPEKNTDWRKGKYVKEMFSEIEIPRSIETMLLDIMKKFGLQFGAFDLIVDKNGNFVFLECNPNGEWAWIEDCTKMPMTDTLIDLLINKHVDA